MCGFKLYVPSEETMKRIANVKLVTDRAMNGLHRESRIPMTKLEWHKELSRINNKK